MRADRMYKTQDMHLDPLISGIDSVDDFAVYADTAEEVLDRLEQIDTYLERYETNTARQGRMSALQNHYPEHAYIAFFDEDGSRVDAFTISERKTHLDDEATYLKQELVDEVTALSNWEDCYDNPQEAVKNSIGFLYTFIERGVGEEMIDPDIVAEYRQAEPDTFFDLFPITGAGHWTAVDTVLDQYMTADRTLQEDGRYGTLMTLIEDGVDELDEVFAETAEQEAAFIQTLYENEADNQDQKAINHPTPFRVNMLKMDDEAAAAYENRAAGMYQ